MKAGDSRPALGMYCPEYAARFSRVESFFPTAWPTTEISSCYPLPMQLWIDKKLPWLAIPHLPITIVVLQLAAFMVNLSQPGFVDTISLVPGKVLDGEVWRLLLFVCVPLVEAADPLSVIFFFAGLYLFWLMGSALEREWSTAGLTCYLLIGYVLTVAAAFGAPQTEATNLYLFISVFFAFAVLFPDFTILLFFLVPVKIKWIALVSGGFILIGFLMGPFSDKLVILAGLANFMLFFGKTLFLKIRSSYRQTAKRQEAARLAEEPVHTCSVGGETDLTHPELTFRYVKEDGKVKCYCEQHLPEQYQNG